ncbi:hypothetical protein GGH95_004137, partial [Coemansia sp. RSA 1836]
MDHRKEELEKKRAKLAELRRQREERKRVSMQTHDQQPAGSTKADSQDINDLVDSLVGDRARAPASPLSTGTPGMSREASGMGRDRSISVATSAGTQMGSPVSRAGTPAGTMAAAIGGGSLGPRALPEFKTCDFVVFDFPPKERVVYNKEVQTADSSDVADGGRLLGEEEIERRVRELRDGDARARAAREEERVRREAEARAKESEIRRLTDEQRARILESSDFAAFVDQKARVLERALDADYDVLVDYTLGATRAGAEARGEQMALAQS